MRENSKEIFFGKEKNRDLIYYEREKRLDKFYKGLDLRLKSSFFDKVGNNCWNRIIKYNNKVLVIAFLLILS